MDLCFLSQQQAPTDQLKHQLVVGPAKPRVLFFADMLLSVGWWSLALSTNDNWLWPPIVIPSIWLLVAIFWGLEMLCLASLFYCNPYLKKVWTELHVSLLCTDTSVTHILYIPLHAWLFTLSPMSFFHVLLSRDSLQLYELAFFSCM